MNGYTVQYLQLITLALVLFIAGLLGLVLGGYTTLWLFGMVADNVVDSATGIMYALIVSAPACIGLVSMLACVEVVSHISSRAAKAKQMSRRTPIRRGSAFPKAGNKYR